MGIKSFVDDRDKGHPELGGGKPRSGGDAPAGDESDGDDLADPDDARHAVHGDQEAKKPDGVSEFNRLPPLATPGAAHARKL